MGSLLRLLKRPGWRGMLLGALCAVASWIACQWPLPRSIEEWLQDGCFAWRGRRPSRARREDKRSCRS